MIILRTQANDLFFLLCMNYVNKFACTFAWEMWQIKALALNLMCVQHIDWLIDFIGYSKYMYKYKVKKHQNWITEWEKNIAQYI